MDLLSRALSGIQVRSPLLARLQVSGDVSIDMMQGSGLPFHYLIDGEMTVEIGGERHDLHAGDLAIFPRWSQYMAHFGSGAAPRSILDFVAERNLPIYSPDTGLDAPLNIEIGASPYRADVLSGNFLVDREETAFLTASLPSFIRLPSRDGSIHASVRALWDIILDELNHTRPGFAATAARGLELLVVQALRSWLLQADQAPLWVRGMQVPAIRRALQAIHAAPGKRWSLAELAAIAGQSRSTFAAHFSQAMGETPFAHLRRLRIHTAASWLRTGRKSISAIAADLGYADSNAFARAFVQEMCITAAAYRRAQRTEESR